jgi:hypothetical protein
MPLVLQGASLSSAANCCRASHQYLGSARITGRGRSPVDRSRTQAWWQIDAERAPRGGLRDIPALRALRAALRETIEALAGGCLAPGAAVVDLSLFM